MLEKIIRTIALPIAPISGLIRLLDPQYNIPKPWKEKNDLFKRAEKATRNVIANTILYSVCFAAYTIVEIKDRLNGRYSKSKNYYQKREK